MKKYLTHTIWLVSLVSFFTDIASEMLYPVMPVFLNSIGFSIILIGILEGVAEATAGISKGYFGQLSDRLGKRVPFIRMGYGLSAISRPMMAAFTFPLWIFFARTLDRVGKGLRTSARDALLSSETTPEHKGKVFGFHRSLDTLGAAIGPVAALIFLSFYPGEYALLFLIAFFPGAIAVLVTFFIRDKKTEKKVPLPKTGFFTFIKYWKVAPPELKVLFTGLLLFTFFNSSDYFLLLMLKYKGFEDTTILGFYIFYNAAYALLAFPAGILADKMGLKKMMLIGLFIFALVYGFFGFADGILLYALLFLGYGFYAAATEGVSKALITNLSGKENAGTAIGFFSSFASIMALLASTIGGIIWFAISPQAMFVFSGAGVLIVFIGFLFMKTKT
ncbi:MAG: MFS transporter [Bacteroidota bacterium]